jgi:formate/nitrite transporter FocA (FNT family)
MMAVTMTTLGGTFSEPIVHVLVANAYAVGFILVVLGRSELFTEHTTLAVVPVLHKQASVRELGRLWGVVYVTNLLGGGAFAGLAVFIGPRLGTVDVTTFTTIARGLLKYSPTVTFFTAILAGWLMGLMTWLVAAGRNTISEAAFVWLIAFMIGFIHLPHSIAGSVEVLLGVFVSDELVLGQFFTFLLWSTIGNIIGGTVFVALLKYGHGINPGRPSEAYETTVETEQASEE